MIIYKFKQAINKFLIYIYAYLFIREKSKTNNYEIILFWGMLGDAVMFLDMLENFAKIVQSRNNNLVVVCRGNVKTVFQKYISNRDIIYIEINKSKLFSEFNYFKESGKILSKYQAKALYHVRASYAVEDIFIHTIQAEKRICFRGDDVDGQSSNLYGFFINHTYDEIFYAKANDDQLTRYSELLKEFGMPEYKSKIFELPVLDVYFSLQKNNYIVICPGASKLEKAWPIEKFLDITEFIAANYSYQIVLSGSSNEKSLGEYIEGNIKSKTRIVNLIGKSDLDQWISVINNAKLVIANESGAVHVAAASKVCSICIGAQEFGDYFLPYRPEFIRENDQLPIVIRSPKMKCFHCKKKNRYIGENGKICYSDTTCFRCVNNITVQQVQNAVSFILD